MKIIFINDKFPPAITGVGNYAFSLAKKLKERGHEMVLICSTQNNDDAGLDSIDGIKIYRVYSNPNKFFKNYFVIYNFQTAAKIKKILREELPDVCHFFNLHEYLSFYLLKISKRYSRVTFWHARDVMSFSPFKLTKFIRADMSLEDIKKENYKLTFLDLVKQSRKGFNPFRNYLIRHYLNYADQLLSVSYALRDAMDANGIKKNIKVLYSGINVGEYDFSENELVDFRRKFNIQNQKILFYGGRLSYSKGAMQAVLALENILKLKKDIILFIAGDKAGYAKTLLNYAKNKGIDKNIIIAGWLDKAEIKKAYLISDIVLNLSVCLDAFPKVNLEAMAAKKPVLGTCFGGTPEIVEDNKTGFIINPLKIDIVAEKILYLLNNPGISMQFGNEGYKRVCDKFNLDNITEELLNYYRKFIG